MRAQDHANFSRSLAQSQVQSPPVAERRLAQQQHLRPEVPSKFNTAVSGFVVNHYHLDIVHILQREGVKRMFQVMRFVPVPDDDRDRWLSGASHRKCRLIRRFDQTIPLLIEGMLNKAPA
jgi:hypothetical protein